ncbi:bifunctional DNA primase/polymerase [Blastococcus sp. BMG 814]|uniref:Bifunctional DNA primase/polymerase n=1 Tax=Blastococcus carthaginiensis TaxID=3050034 RepID=A0ABT9I9C5_9ACTN|nr:bifunctional DNA primase/polymerase [Blastococcus carthaginiensis]MDP5182166.1 bifunctional DNA primase/polymerase [Blastococcus carthaginiensis]
MRCEECSEPLAVAGRGRIPRFCSTRCRVVAHRRRAQLPAELLAAARWVRHDAKRPITSSGAPASSTDPATWTDHRTAARSRAGDGLGFVLGGGFACLDLDHCLDERGRPNAYAAAVLGRLPDAYVEVSPSGDGLHVWGRAPELPGRRHRELEAYSVGRFITVTRRVHRPGGLADLEAWFLD